MRRIVSLFLALILLCSLAACGGTPEPQPEVDPPAGEEVGEVAAPGSDGSSEPEPAPEPEPYFLYDPTVMPEGSTRDGVNYVEYNGLVEHLFFHPVIAYPELAFDGDHMSDGYDDWMVTVGEYNKILQSLYDNDFILVDIHDCWSEQATEDGTLRMKKNTLYLPEGKKPLSKGFKEAVAKMGMKKNEIAVVGDQIYTDVLGANLMNLKMLYVVPIEKEKTAFFVNAVFLF